MLSAFSGLRLGEVRNCCLRQRKNRKGEICRLRRGRNLRGDGYWRALRVIEGKYEEKRDEAVSGSTICGEIMRDMYERYEYGMRMMRMDGNGI